MGRRVGRVELDRLRQQVERLLVILQTGAKARKRAQIEVERVRLAVGLRSARSTSTDMRAGAMAAATLVASRSCRAKTLSIRS